MPLKLPERCHRKRAKGRSYYYFVSRVMDANGKPIRTRLPDFASNGFWRAYSACQEAEEQRSALDSVLTVPALCEKFRRSPSFARKAKGTQESYLTYLRVIETLLDTFLAGEVERRDVIALHEKLAAKPAAANQTIRTLSALYAWAVRHEHVKHNPVTEIEMFPGGEHEPWPEWLLEKALASDDERVRLTAHLLYYTAARVGDVANLRWSDIRDNHWFLVQQKTQDPLEIPLHRNLRALLDGLPKTLTTIIAKPNGKPYSRATVSSWMGEFAAAHGMDLVAHGIRKNAVNALLECGCSVAQTQAISGQSVQMVEHYAKRRNKRRLAGDAIRIWEGTKGANEN